MLSQMDSLTPGRSRRFTRRSAMSLAAFGGAALLLAGAGAAFAQAPPMPANPADSAPATPASYTLNAGESGLKGSQGALKTDIAIDGSMQRYDTTVKLGNGNTFHVVNVLNCATGMLTTSDPALKIYTVNDVSQIRPEVFGTTTLLPSFTPDGRGLIFPLPDIRIASQSGGVGVNVGITDKGMAAVGKTKNAHHYTVSLAYSTSGGAAVTYASQVFDVWTDDAQAQALNCIDSRLLGGGASGAAFGGVTYTLTGDTDKLRAILSAVPVQITYDTGSAAGVITYTLDKLSTKSVDAKLFAAPDARLRQVAANEFGLQERSALVARVQSGGGDIDDSSAGMRTTGPATDPYTQGLNVPQTIGGGG